jgi:hypothetical protein
MKKPMLMIVKKGGGSLSKAEEDIIQDGFIREHRNHW